jgi:hypothetical protein
MSDNQNFGFGKFIPGFDFLQDLAKGASQSLPQMPNISKWVAPTLNLDELEKRIGELKAVHFWLDQNSKALGATIQALEVQKMTLATLKGMNFNMGELANALKLKPAESFFGDAGKAFRPADAVASPAEAPAKPRPARKTDKEAQAAVQPAGGVVDPLQWWGALTQQFQQIAAGAMNDTAAQTAGDGARGTAAAKASARKTPSKVGHGKSATGAKRTPRKLSNP